MENELELINHLQSQNLFDAFKAQLKKDFLECACTADFVDTLPQDFDSLKNLIELELIKNEKRSYFNLHQLLYRIDINENQLNDAVKNISTRSYLNIVSEFIIMRILQKVVLKKYLS